MQTTNDTKTPNWITADELAERLGCSAATVRRMAGAVIPCIRVGVGQGNLRFDPEAVEAALAVRR